jgi:hypothetical protein
LVDGVSGGFLARVTALAVFDDGSGSGPALYAGGGYTNAGAVAANNIAKWDGAAWSPLGTGMNASVGALSVFDDGSGDGPALYAGGSFTIAGGVATNYIAKWDGHEWAPLGSGLQGVLFPRVETLSVFDDGSGGGPALYAGGFFASAGGLPELSIARWQGCASDTPCTGDTNGDNIVNFTDLNAVLADFGQTGMDLPGDTNGDGVVNFTDLNEVLAAFGTSCD